MPEKIMSEFSIKKLFGYHVHQITKHDPIDLSEGNYTIKVDQQIKGRGKKGLIGINYGIDQVKDFVKSKDYQYFVCEPTQTILEEHYFMIRFTDQHDEIYFGENIGGINFSDLSLCRKQICVDSYINFNHEIDTIGKQIYEFYKKYNFTFLEVNPLAKTTEGFICIDFAVKWDVDSCYLFNEDELKLLQFNNVDEKYENDVDNIENQIEELDKKSGASLKFNVLNNDGNIWTLIAGGGASVMYMDSIVNLGYKDNLGNYGEYSGNPTENEVFLYTKLVLEQMLKSKSDEQFYLIVGGGISNFTMVDVTFRGIIKAIKVYQNELKSKNVIVIVRRGGLGYKKGLELFKNCCDEIGLINYIYGPETHITKCIENHFVKKEFISNQKFDDYQYNENIVVNSKINIDGKIVILNLQTVVGQRILDYDYICGNEPSICAFIHSTGSNVNLFYGTKEITIPIFRNIDDVKDAKIALNYYSFRSAYETTFQCLNNKNIETILIVAEGMSMHQARNLYLQAIKLNKTILGPSSVGALFCGNKRFGNAMGSIENIEELGLFNKGHIGLVTKSGGLLNEMANMINRQSNLYAGIAIGGDRIPSLRMVDICMFYQNCDDVKLIILLGEIGGDQELIVAEMIKRKMITKPVIGWCTGTSSQTTGTKQFGHAGSYANNDFETALFKNYYLEQCGAFVPSSFEDIDILIKNKCENLGLTKNNNPIKNKLPFDFSDLIKNNMLRVPTQFVSSISNEKNDLLYNGKELSTFLNENFRIGNVVGNLLFKKNIPEYFAEFLEIVIATTADHGIAVSSAHNTAVCARAGQNISSAVASGLLCIHDKHGGAIQNCAELFFDGFYIKKITPNELIKSTKIIPGIGHMYKNNTTNKDKRIEYLWNFIKNKFPNTDLIDYAKQVEKITLTKKDNLILNVDGLIACSIVNIFVNEYGIEETKKMLSLQGLNSIFIISRTIGLCGTFIDQNRLGQGLYRHPSWGINYML